jgi:hypothetical protein
VHALDVALDCLWQVLTWICLLRVTREERDAQSYSCVNSFVDIGRHQGLGEILGRELDYSKREAYRIGSCCCLVLQSTGMICRASNGRKL